MGRQLRILIPGAVYHVTSRGNERKNIFKDDADRNMLLKTLGEVKSKYDFKILAFVLMNNHYHFLLKTEIMDGVRPRLEHRQLKNHFFTFRVFKYIKIMQAVKESLTYNGWGHPFK